MQKNLFLIRHAKSSWSNPGQTDFERPLNDRGEHDAPMMGARLKDMGIMPDLIVASPAKRAKQTARRIAGALGYEKDCILYEESLYHCTPGVLEKAIMQISPEARTVFIVAHNPGITDFVNSLSPKFRIDNVPTCGITGIRFGQSGWSQFPEADKEVFLFEYPKKYYDSK